MAAFLVRALREINRDSWAELETVPHTDWLKVTKLFIGECNVVHTLFDTVFFYHK